MLLRMKMKVKKNTEGTIDFQDAFLFHGIILMLLSGQVRSGQIRSRSDDFVKLKNYKKYYNANS